jgi:undecaprenyl-diphosphatase
MLVGGLSAAGRGREVDQRAYRTLNRLGGRRADQLFRGITELGSLWAAVGASTALAGRGRRRAAAGALGAAVTMWTVGQGLKKVFDRPRPYRAFDDIRLLIREPAGTSWPSSHPAVLMAFVVVAGEELGISGWRRTATTGLACLVGWSRVHLGVHYPSDVVGGLLLGAAVGRAWTNALPPVAGGSNGPDGAARR